MIITADSGSTSIDWRILRRDWRILRRDEPVRRLVSPGVNPVLQKVEAMRGVFAEALKGVEGPGIRVYFYGAGVVSEAAGEKVRQALRAVLPGCEVTAGSDLEAAAIALLGDRDGVAAILGTGSNSGLYLGGRIVRNIPAGGFILGSGGGQPGLRRRDALAVPGFVLPFPGAAEGLFLCPRPGDKWVPSFPGAQCVALRPS